MVRMHLRLPHHDRRMLELIAKIEARRDAYRRTRGWRDRPQRGSRRIVADGDDDADSSDDSDDSASDDSDDDEAIATTTTTTATAPRRPHRCCGLKTDALARFTVIRGSTSAR